MKFEDLEIRKLNLGRLKDFVKLIIIYLCGENLAPKLEELEREEKDFLLETIQRTKAVGINQAQFNEILHLLEQDRINKDFFEYFFSTNKISKKTKKKKETVIRINEIREGIERFRGYAMLCFGNFRFAYKELIKMDAEELEEKLCSFLEKPSEVIRKFKNRPKKILDFSKIDRKFTWYAGYLTGSKISDQSLWVKNKLKKSKGTSSNKEIKEYVEFGKFLQGIRNKREEIIQEALRITNIYLTWDYMDIYVATSMRNSWEFEEAFDFIQDMFNNKKLCKLKLRVFDPTQSTCVETIDKGLVEGLMLKRAKGTIYMVQESDTMGKDSELAATLAQGKPVIAYVPKISINEYIKKIRNYPLDFFKKRLLILQAEEIFGEKGLIAKLKKVENQFEDIIEEFFEKLKKKPELQEATLWKKIENLFKNKNKKLFLKICKILATAEQYNFNKRAKTLKGSHPLAMQVILESGVANGVLVVRSTKQCAKLLYSILTNSLNFTIEHCASKQRKYGFTKLIEKISGSTFRVVTDFEKLTNSFWNFYLNP